MELKNVAYSYRLSSSFSYHFEPVHGLVDSSCDGEGVGEGEVAFFCDSAGIAEIDQT